MNIKIGLQFASESDRPSRNGYSPDSGTQRQGSHKGRRMLVKANAQRCGFYDVAKNLTILSDPVFSGVRPVKDTHQTTVVTIDFTLYAVLDLDMKSQTLRTFGWLTMKWKNEYLTWDPISFCNTLKVSVAAGLVWKPDLFIFEMTDEDKSPTIQYLLISDDGINIRSEPMMIVSTCGMDTFLFPFDIQTCSLTFGSFLHTVSEITLEAESNSSVVSKTSKELFASKGDWGLLHIDVNNHNLTVEDLIYSQIVYKITLERTPSHYVITLIIPACFLVLIDLASMFIPIDGHERMNFKITLVLGFSVLLLILNDLLPSSQGIPLLEIFCMMCLVVMVLGVAEAIAISYLLEQKSKHQVPSWIKISILKHLARALAIDTKTKDGENGNEATRTLLTKKADSMEAELLMEILKEMIKIRTAIKSKNDGKEKSEWHMVAFVFDRFFFVLYLISIIITTCVVSYIWSK